MKQYSGIQSESRKHGSYTDLALFQDQTSIHLANKSTIKPDQDYQVVSCFVTLLQEKMERSLWEP